MTSKQKLRILVVDDEASIRRFLKASLTSAGFDVACVGDGTTALETSVSYHPDVIILDLGLPDIDGMSIIRSLRSRTTTPIIILSVRDDINDKVGALKEGADDYVTKPFHISELLARIAAVLRRQKPFDASSLFTTGTLSVDIAHHDVRIENKHVDLSPTEYALLKLLVLNAGKVLTHQQLLRELWNNTEELEGALHLLRVTISNLRSKIEPDPNRPSYIITEPCIGYRLHTEQ